MKAIWPGTISMMIADGEETPIKQVDFDAEHIDWTLPTAELIERYFYM